MRLYCGFGAGLVGITLGRLPGGEVTAAEPGAGCGATPGATGAGDVRWPAAAGTPGIATAPGALPGAEPGAAGKGVAPGVAPRWPAGGGGVTTSLCFFASLR